MKKLIYLVTVLICTDTICFGQKATKMPLDKMNQENTLKAKSLLPGDEYKPVSTDKYTYVYNSNSRYTGVMKGQILATNNINNVKPGTNNYFKYIYPDNFSLEYKSNYSQVGNRRFGNL